MASKQFNQYQKGIDFQHPEDQLHLTFILSGVTSCPTELSYGSVALLSWNKLEYNVE